MIDHVLPLSRSVRLSSVRSSGLGPTTMCASLADTTNVTEVAFPCTMHFYLLAAELGIVGAIAFWLPLVAVLIIAVRRMREPALKRADGASSRQCRSRCLFTRGYGMGIVAVADCAAPLFVGRRHVFADLWPAPRNPCPTCRPRRATSPWRVCREKSSRRSRSSGEHWARWTYVHGSARSKSFVSCGNRTLVRRRTRSRIIWPRNPSWIARSPSSVVRSADLHLEVLPLWFTESGNSFALHWARLGLILAAATLGIGGALWFLPHGVGTPAFALLMLATVFDQWNETAWPITRATDRAWREPAVSGVTSVLCVAVCAFQVYYVDSTLTQIAITVLAASICRAFIVLLVTHMGLPRTYRKEVRTVFATGIRSAWPYMTADLLGLVYLRGDTIILDNARVATRVGILRRGDYTRLPPDPGRCRNEYGCGGTRLAYP